MSRRSDDIIENTFSPPFKKQFHTAVIFIISSWFNRNKNKKKYDFFQDVVMKYK